MNITGYDYTKIPNPFDSNMQRVKDSGYSTDEDGNPVIGGGLATYSSNGDSYTGKEATEEKNIDGKTLRDVWLDTFIKSKNYKPKVSGFMIDGKTGDAEFSDITLSGGNIQYGKISFNDTTNPGYYISSSGFYFGSASDASYVKYNIGTGAFTIKSTLLRTSDGSTVIDSSGDLINDKLDTSSKKILSDFTFEDDGGTNYTGAFKTGTITWDSSDGSVTGGSGILINAAGIVGANSGSETFTIDATTGNAVYYGNVTASQILTGTLTSQQITLNADGTGDSYLASGSARTYFPATKLLGDSTSQFDITSPDTFVLRVTWDGNGTNPNIGSNMNIGDTVAIYFLGGGGYGDNGEYVVTSVDTDYFEFTDNVAGTASNVTIGDGKLEICSPGFIIGVDDSDSDTSKLFIGDFARNMSWNGNTLYIKGSLETQDFKWVTLFESIDGFDTGGTGTETITIGVQGISMTTDTTSGDTATVRKYLSDFTEFTWDKNRVIKTNIYLNQVTNQTIYLITGSDTGNNERIGFKIIDNTLYGVISDGLSEQTISLQTISASTEYFLEFRWYATDRCEFFINGVFKGMFNSVDDDLPSGDSSAFRFMQTEIETNENLAKTMFVRYWSFWQEY